MLLARFEPATPASEWPQTHALGRAATGTGRFRNRNTELYRNTAKNDTFRKNLRNI